MNDCTLLISSYDGGSDIWHYFFTILKDQWPDLDMPIVLNTESLSYSFDGFNIKTFSLFKNRKVSWAKRLKETLKRIDTDYVILLLEDYWFEDKVNDELIKKTIDYIKHNNSIASFIFMPVGENNIDDNAYKEYELRDQKGKYRFTCQAGIWDRKKLISYLRNHESAWDWEKFGSIRSRRYKDKFYVLKKGLEGPFKYHRGLGGVVHRGKWIKNVAEPFEKKYGFKIDYSNRGYIFEDESSFCREKSTFKEKTTKPNLFKRTKTIVVSCVHKVLSII